MYRASVFGARFGQCLVAATALGLLILPSAGAASVATTPRIGEISTSVPSLNRAGAVGSLVALDPAHAVAEFDISCGRYAFNDTMVHPGRFRVDLRGATFGWAVNYNAHGGGRVVDFNLRRWEAAVTRVGWHGTLYLRTPNAPRVIYLTDGASTNVCAGAFG